MRQRDLTAAIAAAALLTACASATTPADGGAPAVARIRLDRVPPEPAHPGDLAPLPAAAPDPAAPADVAVGMLRDGLAAQGRWAVDLGASTILATSDRTTVRVTISHTDDTAAVHTSIYEVDLQRTDDGTWTVATARAVS